MLLVVLTTEPMIRVYPFYNLIFPNFCGSFGALTVRNITHLLICLLFTTFVGPSTHVGYLGFYDSQSLSILN